MSNKWGLPAMTFSWNLQFLEIRINKIWSLIFYKVYNQTWSLWFERNGLIVRILIGPNLEGEGGDGRMIPTRTMTSQTMNHFFDDLIGTDDHEDF